jgi:hypothetical protein
MRAIQLTVGTVVAFAAVAENKQFLSGAPAVDNELPNEVQKIPNEVQQLSQEVVNAADVDGDHVVSSKELNQGVDAASQAVQEGVARASAVMEEVTENIQKILPENIQQVAAQFPNLSLESMQKKFEEMPDSPAKKQMQEMLSGLFAQVDQNGDKNIDGQEVVVPMGDLLKQANAQLSDVAKQFGKIFPGMISGVFQQAKTAIAAVDRNQDGSIDADEVAATIEESLANDDDIDEDEDIENEEEEDDSDDE